MTDQLEQARARKARNDELAASDAVLPFWLSGDDRIYVMNRRLERLLPTQSPLLALDDPPSPEPPPARPQRRETPPSPTHLDNGGWH